MTLSLLDTIRDPGTPRSDWSREEVKAIHDAPFAELMHAAGHVHRLHHRAGEVQKSQLLSIKTGGCPEDCGYCNQSAKFDTGLKASRLMDTRNCAGEGSGCKSWRRDPGSAWGLPGGH